MKLGIESTVEYQLFVAGVKARLAQFSGTIKPDDAVSLAIGCLERLRQVFHSVGSFQYDDGYKILGGTPIAGVAMDEATSSGLLLLDDSNQATFAAGVWDIGASAEQQPEPSLDFLTRIDANLLPSGISRECREWLNLYPKHARTGQRACGRVFESVVAEIMHLKVLPRDKALKFLMDQTALFAKSDLGRDEQYCWGAEKFLNDGHWADHPDAWKRSAKKQSGPRVAPVEEKFSK